jgi:GntR family transcriptional regulator
MHRPKRGPIPHYHRISELLRERIETGLLKQGDRIPTEEELRLQFAVSRTTVRQALQRLEQDGLIERHAGRGSFVAYAEPSAARFKMTCLLGDLISLGLPATASLKERAIVVPPPAVAESMGLEAGETVLTFLKLVSVDDRVFAVRRTYLPQWMSDRLSDDDLRSERLLAVLASKCGVRCIEAEQLVEALVADSEMSGYLGLEVGSPVLSVTRSTVDHRRACIEHSINLYRSDRTRFYIAQKQQKSSQDGWILSAMGNRAASRQGRDVASRSVEKSALVKKEAK